MTAVGGTTTAIGAAGNLEFSTGWRTDKFVQSADGVLEGETQVFPGGSRYDEFRIGGTSVATPLLAGFTALALQSHGGAGAGLLDPVIYRNGRNGLFIDVRGSPPDSATSAPTSQQR